MHGKKIQQVHFLEVLVCDSSIRGILMFSQLVYYVYDLLS